MFRRVARAITPKKWHLTGRLQSAIVRRANGRVVTGMFAGMQYVEQSSGSVWLPKLLGTYEQELAPHLEPLLRQNFDVIVVAGAAEGYYAVGFALKSNAQKIVAFEPNPQARGLLSELALKNGVAEQVIVKGICDLSGLKAVLDASSKSLVFVDIEGGEALLLDPLMIPQLQKSTIVVEVHEMAIHGVGQLLRDRFRGTHNVVEQPTVQRTAEDYPLERDGMWRQLTDGAVEQLLSERRGGEMSWLILTPTTTRA